MVALSHKGVKDLGSAYLLANLRLGFFFRIQDSCCSSYIIFTFLLIRKKKKEAKLFSLRLFCRSCMYHFSAHPSDRNLIM